MTARYPEGHPELRRARRRLFADALKAARYGVDETVWGHRADADDLDAISQRDYRAIVAYAWGQHAA